MHANTDSEATSLSASSSPPRRGPVYYVQSPSRDSSHDGEKTTASFHSTPVLSPSASPHHSHSSLGHHSRESSSTRFSGSLKPGSRKISPNDTNAAAAAGRKGGHKPWKECDVIEEEGLLEEEEYEKPLSRRLYFLAFILGFFVLFTVFSLILWGAARAQKPKVTMKSIKIERFSLSSGSDATGVATEMASVNCTLKFLYRNTATFFGVHVTSSPIDLSYSQITLATGNVKKFYESRKSQRLVTVSVLGDKIPLYGSSSTMVGTSTGVPTAPVTMNLNFVVRSRAYVLGSLVKPKFLRRIECSVTLNPKKLNSAISLKNACVYQ